MSVIAIVLERDDVSPAALLKLHHALGVSLREVKDTWSAGAPVVEVEIFEGDYRAHAAQIRSVLKIAGEERLYVKCYEIPHGERYADNADLNIFSIDESLVESILDSADKEVQRQRES